ncbi:hypothetical protein L1887_35639 [Cichorium endivia]|nr:hypothetical protein L1887_35639 [Cichorium endivia]
MECNKDEAIRAKEIAEQKMRKNDFEGARNIALKAKNLYPELDNISRLIAVCDVHCSSLKKINSSEKDLYGILQIPNIADEATIRKQYRKLALVLHPDKNTFPGAEAAFKLIGEANMILSDKEKRSLYDAKCRQPVKVPVTKPQNRQNHVKKQFTGQNKFDVPNSHYNGVNHRQPPVTESTIRPSFWTYCPFCNTKYEYYREFVNRPLRCQHCNKLFIAYDIGSQGENLGAKRAQPPPPQPQPPPPQQPQPSFSHTEQVRRRERVKVQIQKDRKSSSSNAKTEVGDSSKSKGNNVKKPVKTEPSKDTKKRGRKTVTEASESGSDVGGSGGGGGGGGGGGVDNRKSSRQKQQVSYNEDELSPQKKPRKSSDDVEDVKKENGSHVNLDDDNHDDDDDDDKYDSEPEFVDCPDLEFSNFDKDKEENCFAVDQIWACYDSVDGMPRFYARIRKIFTREFKLKITWLEADPDTEPEIKWAEEGLPVGCGKFTGGETEETKDRLMFSHKIDYKTGVKRNSFFIYPKKGEIWALFKDWDINWGLDPENHKNYKFDIVEVGEVHDNGSVSVALLVKVKGFVSLFQRTVWGGLSDRKIPGNELFRFSHRIPSTKLTGAERAGVPPGSFELDTASLPDDLEKYYYSVQPEIINLTTPKKNVNPEGKGKIGINLRRSPRGLKNGVKDSNCEDGNGNLPKRPHDFAAQRRISNFSINQVWAFWEIENGTRQCYGKIIKIEHESLHVSLLESININKPNVCGLFKKSGRTKLLPLDVFSHIVKFEESGENFKIFPREQQIWGLNKRKDAADCTSGECEIVQVLESDESSVKVMFLTRVPGYKLVFKAPRVQRSSDNIVVIPRKELNRFTRHIPSFHFTEEKDGALRGCWELDPQGLTGLPLHGLTEGRSN